MLPDPRHVPYELISSQRRPRFRRCQPSASSLLSTPIHCLDRPPSSPQPLDPTTTARYRYSSCHYRSKQHTRPSINPTIQTRPPNPKSVFLTSVLLQSTQDNNTNARRDILNPNLYQSSGRQLFPTIRRSQLSAAILPRLPYNTTIRCPFRGAACDSKHGGRNNQVRTPRPPYPTVHTLHPPHDAFLSHTASAPGLRPSAAPALLQLPSWPTHAIIPMPGLGSPARPRSFRIYHPRDDDIPNIISLH